MINLSIVVREICKVMSFFTTVFITIVLIFVKTDYNIQFHCKNVLGC